MSDNNELSSAELNKLAEMIRELGYKAKAVEDRFVETSMSGFITLIFLFPDAIQMYTGFHSREGVFGFEQANAFNEQFRLVKCYLKKGIRFEGDFLFDLESDDAEEELEKIFKSWEITLGVVSESLVAAQEAFDEVNEGGADDNQLVSQEDESKA